MVKVFIDGKEGTTGLRLFDRLKGRSEIGILTLSEENRKDVAARKEKINESDVTFLCLPDDKAIESVSLLENDKTVVIDASTAHRTSSDFTYGFAELSDCHKERIKTCKKIAVPGCHASGFISIVYPLIASGVMGKDYPITATSLTGYSGGGKKMIAEYENAKSDGLYSPRCYALTQNHKHLKEMKAVCGLDNYPVFSPIVDDYYSGMEVNVPIFINMLKGVSTVKQVRELYKEHYKTSKLIKVLDEDFDFNGFVPANMQKGKDTMKIAVLGNDERITVLSVFDNLGKGASGAAVQCFNISQGFEETEGLEF